MTPYEKCKICLLGSLLGLVQAKDQELLDKIDSVDIKQILGLEMGKDEILESIDHNFTNVIKNINLGSIIDQSFIDFTNF